MRPIADMRETVCEFRVSRRIYRLILPTGKNTFAVDRLVRDQWRPWIGRWNPYGVGMHADGSVLSTVRDSGREMPPRIVAAIAQCIRYILHGPLSAKRIYNA